ncbi:hypothetical protein GCM10023178_53920 [Actinomadura luteofluorescens]
MRNTFAMADARSEDAAYGRSFTYWPSEKSGVPLPRVRTSWTGSTSSSKAAVQRCSSASG